MDRYESWDPQRAAAIVALHVGREGALLPILHAVQETFGYVPDAAVPIIAQALNLSRADVHGTVSFYHDFRREPAGRHVLKLCRAEACQARGANALAAQVMEKLHVAMGETTADGRVTLEPVFCLGLCASGPSAMLDGRPLARLDTAKVERLIEEAGP